MELVVRLLLVLTSLSSFFQMSHWRLLPRLIAGLLLSFISYLLYPWMIEQSRDQLNLWLGDVVMMQNLAVIQVVEALIFISIDLAMLKGYFGKPVSKYKRYASFFPGIMLFAVLLYAQMMTFYSFTKMEFDALGLYFSVGVGVIIFLFPLGIKWIIPENHLRMELRYILCFGQILGAVMITVFCQVLPYRPTDTEIEFNPLLVVFGLAILMFLIGWGWSIFKNRIKFKWKY